MRLKDMDWLVGFCLIDVVVVRSVSPDLDDFTLDGCGHPTKGEMKTQVIATPL